MDENNSNWTFDGWQKDEYLNVTHINASWYATPLLGYYIPILNFVTIITNTLVILVLTKPHMRSTTNVLLIALAISDMMSFLPTAPWIIYFYTFGNHWKPLYPVPACYAMAIMWFSVPVAFHNTSIWLTLTLAGQRLISIRNPTQARVWITMSRVKKCIFWIYAITFGHSVSRGLIDRMFVTKEIIWEGEVVQVCGMQRPTWIKPEVLVALQKFYSVSNVLLFYIPGPITLSVLTILLICELRKATRTRRQLFEGNRTMEANAGRESNSITGMLILLIVVFLVVELPISLIGPLYDFMPETFQEYFMWTVVYYSISLPWSFIANIFIYCGMSKQFRDTLRQLLFKK